MPSTLKAVKTGPEPVSARKIRQYLEKHVKPDAPYYANNELIELLKVSSSTVRAAAKPHLGGWYKKLGPFLWWSTPEHIKKL